MAATAPDSVLWGSGARYAPSPDSDFERPASTTKATAPPPTAFTPQSDKEIAREEEEEADMESCRVHAYEEHHHDVETISRIATTSRATGQAITPFLVKNIPALYAPTGSKPIESSLRDRSTKFCYRHRPDLKCRRTANEPSMDNLQRVRAERDFVIIELY